MAKVFEMELQIPQTLRVEGSLENRVQVFYRPISYGTKEVDHWECRVFACLYSEKIVMDNGEEGNAYTYGIRPISWFTVGERQCDRQCKSMEKADVESYLRKMEWAKVSFPKSDHAPHPWRKEIVKVLSEYQKLRNMGNLSACEKCEKLETVANKMAGLLNEIK